MENTVEINGETYEIIGMDTKIARLRKPESCGVSLLVDRRLGVAYTRDVAGGPIAVVATKVVL